MEDRVQNGPIANAFATKTDLDSIIHSKEHFIMLFAVRGGYLLLPRPFIAWRYIRSILKGEKKLLLVSEVPALYKPPKVSELTVGKLYEQLKTDIRVTQYLPDTTKPHDKMFFFSVLAAVIPEFYLRVLEAIKQNRRQEVKEEEKIELTAEMKHLLELGVPYFGPTEKVGHFLSQGRQWTNSGPS